jgi:WD40 repeat protein
MSYSRFKNSSDTNWLVRASAMLLVTCVATLVAAADPSPLAKHERWVTNLAFSPDGAVLATVGGESLQPPSGRSTARPATSGRSPGRPMARSC